MNRPKSDTQPLDSWSWEAVSLEYQQKLNRRYDERPKILEDRLVSQYLVNKCVGCTENPCLNYHKGQQPRRPLVYLGKYSWNYSSKKCKNTNCRLEKCPYAHTTEEIYYHPENFRKKSCNYPLLGGKCSKFGEFCPFIHEQNNAAEEKIVKFNLETYKVERCMEGEQHNYANCYFYHENLRVCDKRRSLKEFQYYPELCPESEKCEMGDKCQFCHTMVELKYHPSKFKTKPCIFKENCLNKEACPFYHQECNDRVDDRAKEINDLLSEFQDLNEKLLNMQQKGQKLEKFICSQCLNQQSDFIFTCGHPKCSDCSLTPICSICQRETEVFTRIKKN